MIELNDSCLMISFPEVHPQAKLNLNFQRTLRIPDDGKTYPLPPGLGSFPLRHVDDFADRVPASWREHGGVMLPMYQSEALWLSIVTHDVDNRAPYPFAVKVSTGKIDALTGEAWRDGLHRRPQNYLVAPTQPWLDGFCVKKGLIRQFVAMPLGAGYSAEEQVTGKAEHGGMQIAVYPMKREVFERRFPKRKHVDSYLRSFDTAVLCKSPAAGMGLAPGGKMKQEIYQDPFDFADWDTSRCSRCFVHLANSLVWRGITGSEPPTVPMTSREYTECGLPWFDYYDDSAVPVNGSSILQALQSVNDLGQQLGEVPLPENESVRVDTVVPIHGRNNVVREGNF